GDIGPCSLRWCRAARRPAASGPPSNATQASTTSGSAADPGSQGFVACLASPSGATAYMTTPRPAPAPVPIASVAGATDDRRAVTARMTATEQAVTSPNTISPVQECNAAGRPRGRPGPRAGGPSPPGAASPQPAKPPPGAGVPAGRTSQEAGGCGRCAGAG